MRARHLAAFLALSAVASASAQHPPDPAGPAIPDSAAGLVIAPGLPAYRPVKPAVVRTLAQITFINIVAVGINTLARDITPPSLSSWRDNLGGGWSWDPNSIRVNQLEHPWAGAGYFNSGRGNGLSFWGSAPMALTGSLMWELFGESKSPSINDVMSTSLTGVSLGEPLHRLSLLVLDEESSGLDRLWREVVVFLGNPGLGLSRVSRGQAWNRRQNPGDRRPTAMRGRIGVGGRHLSWEDGRESLNTPVLSLDIDYGDPFAAAPQGPFAYFSASMELMPSSPDALGTMAARGLLARFGGDDQGRTHVGGVFMDFDYRRDGVVDFGEQSFGVGLLSRFPLGEGFRVDTDISLEAVPILAVQDRYSKPVTRRNYDYAAGAGARMLAGLEHRGRRLLSASARTYWGSTLNGASETKLVQLATLEARTPPVRSLSLGASYQFYLQGSTYADRARETERISSLSVFLSSAR